MEEKWEYNGAVYQLFIDFKKAYDSVRIEVLLIKMCLNETYMYRKVHIGKNLLNAFLFRMV
jgi:hypothetical protein